jgi:hypothetical protein
MPRDQDGPQRQVEALRRFLSKRARLEPERMAAAEVDPAASQEPGTVQRRLVSLFEPDQPDPPPTVALPVAGAGPQPGAPLRARRAWLLLAPAGALAVGLLLGFALGSARAGGEPTSAMATGSPATQPAPKPSPSVVARPTASPACLETARRGDQIIHLFVTNRRSRAADLLVAYTVASRQCRRDVSP